MLAHPSDEISHVFLYTCVACLGVCKHNVGNHSRVSESPESFRFADMSQQLQLLTHAE